MPRKKQGMLPILHGPVFGEQVSADALCPVIGMYWLRILLGPAVGTHGTLIGGGGTLLVPMT
jgi:hypothetical protein